MDAGTGIAFFSAPRGPRPPFIVNRPPTREEGLLLLFLCVPAFGSHTYGGLHGGLDGGGGRDANGIASAEDGAMGGVAPCGIPTLYRHT